VIQPADSTGTRPIRAESRNRLLNGIAKAQHWLGEILAGSIPDIETISQRENMSARTARMTLSLAFIAPDIVEAVANGTLPRGFGLSRLTDLPINWARQRQKLGLPARS
jgi:site-specific DNA recombinase